MFGTGWVDRRPRHRQSQIPAFPARYGGIGLSGSSATSTGGASLAEITDGASNTIAMGEVRPKCAWHVRDGWMHPEQSVGLHRGPNQLSDLPGRAGVRLYQHQRQRQLGGQVGLRAGI